VLSLRALLIRHLTDEYYDHGSLPSIKKHLNLRRFPTLQYPLQNAKIVALYFGGSQYSESRFLRDSFLRDERLLPQEGTPLEKNKKYPLAIVYVPIDNVEGSSQWIHVESMQERRALLAKFHVGPDKALQIPSLLVLDAQTNAVLSIMGLQELHQEGPDGTLDAWFQYKVSIASGLAASSELFQDDDQGVEGDPFVAVKPTDESERTVKERATS
jgi:hypothetical protein